MDMRDSVNGHTGSIPAVSISSTEKLLATASSDGTLKLWDIASGVELKQLRIAVNTKSISFCSIDNEILIVTENEEPKLWDLQLSKHVKHIKSYKENARSPAF